MVADEHGDLTGEVEDGQLRDRYQRLIDTAKAQRAALTAYLDALSCFGGGCAHEDCDMGPDEFAAAWRELMDADKALAAELEQA